MTDKIKFYDTNGFEQNSSNINVNSLSINGVTLKYKSSIKATVDPTSNTGPFNGLLILAQPDFSFQMPLRIIYIPSLKLANSFIDDPNGDYTLNSNFIRINNVGTFSVGFNIVILSNNINERKSVWILNNGDVMFVNAPIAASNIRQPGSITNPFYTSGYVLEANAIINVTTVPNDICVTLFLNNNTSNNEIIRSSFLNINRIS